MQQNRKAERSTGNLPENIKRVLDGGLVIPVLCHRIHPITGEPNVTGHADPFGMGIAAALVQRSTGAPR
ncbi:hypothetical protein NKH71_03845 [Mesorhizobium sp. M0983]|uniref:hypothetical protein n=1 Tax=Mesorhizobium sp. M0983 TaxID=2957040 RepID=UPI00333ADC76